MSESKPSVCADAGPPDLSAEAAVAAAPTTDTMSVRRVSIDDKTFTSSPPELDGVMRRVLAVAHEHCLRRGSRVLREVDMAFAVAAVRKSMHIVPRAKTPRWYMIPVAGDGGCLFTSMRLVLELHYVARHVAAGAPPERLLIDGMHPKMVNAGRTLRATVVEWYRRFLEREVPQLGEYNAGGRMWQRGDLLALEMVRRGKDMPEAGPARTAAMLEYLVAMARPGVWGGTPEYTAVACMTHKTVRIWQFQAAAGGARALYNVNTIAGVAPVQAAGGAGAPGAAGPGAAAPGAAGPAAPGPAGPAGPDAPALPAPAGPDAEAEPKAAGGCGGGGDAMSLDGGGAGLSPPASPGSAQLDAEVYEDMDGEGDDDDDEEGDDDDDDEEGDDEDSEDVGLHAGQLCMDLFFENNHYVAMVSASTRRMLAAAYGEAVVAHLRPLA